MGQKTHIYDKIIYADGLTDDELQRRLYHLLELGVGQFAAAHPQASPELLTQALLSSDDSAKFMAERHPALPAEAIVSYYERTINSDPDSWDGMDKLIAHPNTPGYILEAALAVDDEFTQGTVVRNPNISQELLLSLVTEQPHAERFMREALRNPNLPAGLLRENAHLYPENAVLNPSLHEKTLKKILMKGGSIFLRSLGMANPQFGRSTFEALKQKVIAGKMNESDTTLLAKHELATPVDQEQLIEAQPWLATHLPVTSTEALTEYATHGTVDQCKSMLQNPATSVQDLNIIYNRLTTDRSLHQTGFEYLIAMHQNVSDDLIYRIVSEGSGLESDVVSRSVRDARSFVLFASHQPRHLRVLEGLVTNSYLPLSLIPMVRYHSTNLKILQTLDIVQKLRETYNM